jgi:hypothetical protein
MSSQAAQYRANTAGDKTKKSSAIPNPRKINILYLCKRVCPSLHEGGLEGRGGEGRGENSRWSSSIRFTQFRSVARYGFCFKFSLFYYSCACTLLYPSHFIQSRLFSSRSEGGVARNAENYILNVHRGKEAHYALSRAKKAIKEKSKSDICNIHR